jgi:hypothetical protein
MKRVAALSVTQENGKLVETLRLEGNPLTDAAARAPMHEDAIAGGIYRAFLAGLGEKTGLLEGTALAYAQDLLQSVRPRDEMERMLVTHALWCHGRIAKLNVMLTKTARIDEVRVLSELIGRASNDFRKAMLGLSEYRQPRRVYRIQQLNQAGQQVVNNGNRKTNERRKRAIPARSTRALSPAKIHEGRPRSAARSRSKNASMGALNWPAKRRG